MGNQIDRITHLNYSELPTGDPSGMERDELRVGVAYFFSEEEEEEEQELGLWREPSPPRDELEFSAFCRQECIFSKLGHQDLRLQPVSALLPRCRAGDLLELPGLSAGAAGGAGGGGAAGGHWAVYVGESQVIHLHRQEIRRERLQEVSGGRPARIVSAWYRYRPLPAELVLHNARGHVGLQGRDICWANSESFAAWCRFGKREFKAGGEVANAGERRYFLKLHLSASRVHTLTFPSLEDLIREKRRRDAGGRVGVLKELAILNQE